MRAGAAAAGEGEGGRRKVELNLGQLGALQEELQG